MKKKQTDTIKNYESRLNRWRDEFGSRVHEILDATKKRPDDRWSVFNFVVYWRIEIGGKLTTTERMIAGFSGFHCNVDNGGMHQFFANGSGKYWPSILQILVDSGDKTAEKWFRDALEIFPKSKPSLDDTVRWKQLETLKAKDEDAMWDWFDKHTKVQRRRDYPSASSLWKALKNRKDCVYIPDFRHEYKQQS